MGEIRIYIEGLKRAMALILNEYNQGVYGKSLKLLRTKFYKMKNTEIQYRTVNHWTQAGILSEDRADDDLSWRGFSLLDLFWLNIVVKMRSFGMLMKPIQKCKNELFQEIDKGFTKFDFVFIHCARIELYDLYLVILYDGTPLILTKEDIEQNERDQKEMFDAYLTINLNNMFPKLIPNAPEGAFKTFSEFRTHLNKPEKEVIDVLRDDEVSHVEVHKKNGEIEKFSKTRVIESTDNLWQELMNTPFGHIKIKRQDGKNVFIEIKESKKI